MKAGFMGGEGRRRRGMGVAAPALAVALAIVAADCPAAADTWLANPNAGNARVGFQVAPGLSEVSSAARASVAAQATRAPAHAQGALSLVRFQDADEDAPRVMPPEATPIEPEEPLGQAPPDTSTLFLRQVTVLLTPGTWDLDYGLRYTWEEIHRAIVIPIPNPRVVDTQRQRYRQWTVPLALRYGLCRRVQLYVNMPAGVAMSELAHPFADDFDGVGGIGDTSAGATILLRERRPFRPDWVLNVGFTAPTGAHIFRAAPIPVGFIDPNPSFLGRGFWALNTSLNFIKSVDPVVIFGGIGYTHEFSRDYLGVHFRPGEVFHYQFGIGFAANERMTLSTVLINQIQGTWSGAGQSLPATSTEPMALRFALTVSSSPYFIVEPYVSVGLNSDAPEADLGVILTRRFR